MKGSDGSSGATAKGGATDPTARSSPTNPPSPKADPSASFALAGPSNLPDPAYAAYRQDLADIALAGQVIASHYAEPLLRHLAEAAPLFADRGEDAEQLAELAKGETIEMLDCSLGWAWGYAGKDRRVGYVRASALRPATTT